MDPYLAMIAPSRIRCTYGGGTGWRLLDHRKLRYWVELTILS